MSCILFSGAYFTPKAGMVGFLLLLNSRDRHFPATRGKGSNFARPPAAPPRVRRGATHPWGLRRAILGAEGL